MKVITDGTEQLIDLLANDTPLQLPTFRHEVMPSSQSHQVGQTSTRPHQGNDEGGPASTTTPIADETKNGNGYTSPLSFFSSFHPCCQQHKTVVGKKTLKGVKKGPFLEDFRNFLETCTFHEK